MLQLELLKPKFAILDETDSGLDVDALRIVSEGVNRAKEANKFGILMVTHYTRILKYIKPDIVHVFADGHFVKTGGPELADELEENGYDQYLPEGADSERLVRESMSRERRSPVNMFIRIVGLPLTGVALVYKTCSVRGLDGRFCSYSW